MAWATIRCEGMGRLAKFLLAMAPLAAAGLAACSHAPPPATKAPSHEHISPPTLVVQDMPPGTFDRDKETAEVAAAKAARAAGDYAGARRSAETAIGHWPADPAAWTELAADCFAASDAACQNYAAFFRAKIDFTNTLPPRAGVLGFANIAESPVGTMSGNYRYDQRTIDTARRLEAFYDEQDPLRGHRPVTKPGQQQPKKPPAAGNAAPPAADQASPSTSRTE